MSLKEKQYKVIVKSDVLGDCESICTKEQLKHFNIVAYALTDKVDQDGRSHTSGMWTISPVEVSDEGHNNERLFSRE